MSGIKMAVLGGLFAAFGAAYFTGFLRAPSTESGQAAADFSLRDEQGVVHRLSELRGKRVILHFWANWCAPCLEEFPRLIEAFQHASDPNLYLVTVSWDASWAEANAVLGNYQKRPARWISVIDSKRELSSRYGTYQLPETYLIDSAGKIVTKWVGSQRWDASEWKALFEAK